MVASYPVLACSFLWGGRGGQAETVRWSGARVVYGDTDSLFVHLPGRSVAEAFATGRAIAAAVTAENPRDVVLQFEKVLTF